MGGAPDAEGAEGGGHLAAVLIFDSALGGGDRAAGLDDAAVAGEGAVAGCQVTGGQGNGGHLGAGREHRADGLGERDVEQRGLGTAVDLAAGIREWRLVGQPDQGAAVCPLDDLQAEEVVVRVAGWKGALVEAVDGHGVLPARRIHRGVGSRREGGWGDGERDGLPGRPAGAGRWEAEGAREA